MGGRKEADGFVFVWEGERIEEKEEEEEEEEDVPSPYERGPRRGGEQTEGRFPGRGGWVGGARSELQSFCHPCWRR